ncbi:MCE family protein [Saccharopolyspora aridisoli]|uniref:MCE family protein n=1 Tax=Saccharopolyspora aridisoli TaxID=2530385 RepID=A0A4R4UK57_9PSEU|nr:MCE family protein [Saccharopolyspora aridisoli]TDC90556.1 MCE family protein [Saccharopolyspora aridisoli]
MSRLTRTIAVLCALALVTTGALWWTLSASGTTITAYFDKAVGLYAGSSVRVLGVKVGQIDAVTPEGPVVRVDMHVDDGVSIPADANAVVVAPSLVSDRYVQLTPAYTQGEVMASGAVLDRKRTATPAELDELYKSVNALSTALGPDGANREGALNDVVNTTAATVDGNGQDLNTTIKRLGELSTTLSENQGDLFATVDNLNRFTGTLAQSDEQIRELYGRMADTTGYLASEREQLGTSLHSLAIALDDVQRFVHDNRDHMSSNVRNLTGVTRALVDQREALAEVLDLMPLATTNFINAYDSASGSVASRWNPQELAQPPILLVCRLIANVTPLPEPIPQSLRDTCEELNPVVEGLAPLPSVADVLGKLQTGSGDVPDQLGKGENPVPLPLVDAMKRGAGTP